jgi:hypothetical protein
MNRSALTGNAAGMVFCPVELDPSGIYEVPQGALPAGEVQLGGLLNINATADGLAKKTNGDPLVFLKLYLPHHAVIKQVAKSSS